MDEKHEIFLYEGSYLSGDNYIQMSIFAVLSLKICVTDKQFLHFQHQLLKPAK